jgi:hypothetical protein
MTQIPRNPYLKKEECIMYRCFFQVTESPPSPPSYPFFGIRFQNNLLNVLHFINIFCVIITGEVEFKFCNSHTRTFSLCRVEALLPSKITRSKVKLYLCSCN